MRHVRELPRLVRATGKGLLPYVFLPCALLAGCVTEPVAVAPPPPVVPNTTVYFYPTHGQSAEQQDRDKYECHLWAVQQSGFDPSQPTTPPHLRVYAAQEPAPGSGVVAGAATGAVLGAVVSRPWEAGQGAFVGGVLGALVGAAAESAQRERAQAAALANADAVHDAGLEHKASDYRRAMSACLEGRGYSIR